MPADRDFSRRERQIMDVLYAKGAASANQVCEGLPDAPSPMAVRRLLQILEEKGHIRRSGKQGREVLFSPRRPREQAGRADLSRVLRTFFGGSLAGAFLAHLQDPGTTLDPDELKRLEQVIRQARKKET